MRENMKQRRWYTRPMAAMLCMVVAMSIMPATASAKTVKLYVDPGHGGKDPGAVSGSVYEKDIVLALGKEIREAGKRQGWKVKMSRDTDVFVPLKERARRANHWGATSFVSIHNNSTGDKSLGNMTIYRSNEGKQLGKLIMKEMDQLTPYKDIGNRRDVRGLAVLRGTNMPSVLVEVLSVSPKRERERLQDPEFRKEAAEAIVKGIAKYEGTKYVPPVEPKPEKKNEPAPAAEVKDEKPKAVEAPASEPKPAAEPKQAPENRDEPVKKETAAPEPVREPVDDLTEPALSTAAVDESVDEQTDAVAPRAGENGPRLGWLGSLWRLLTR